MMIATLNAVLVDGGKDDIVAIGLVKDEYEGELWFGENKPDDGTQVDYVLHNISEVFAAPDLLAACEIAILTLTHEPINPEDIEFIAQAIAKAK